MAILYPDFLSNAFEYRAAQLEWIDLWKHVGTGPDWQFPWLPNKSGNPIFSVFSLNEAKAVQIVQVDPTNAPAFMFAAWTSPVFDREAGITFDRLAIVCILDEAALRRTHQLIEDWIHEGISPSSQISEQPSAYRNTCPIRLV